MSFPIKGLLIAHCPKCGEAIKFEKIKAEHVSISERLEYAGNTGFDIQYNHIQQVTLEISNPVVTDHECNAEDTDGLRPIERFLKHGTFDDQGRLQINLSIDPT